MCIYPPLFRTPFRLRYLGKLRPSGGLRLLLRSSVGYWSTPIQSRPHLHLAASHGKTRRRRAPALAHEVVKLAIKKLVLSCPTPAGCVFPSAYVLIEPRHLRHDNSRPRDLYAMGLGLHPMDVVMDVVITCGLQRSCLSHSSTSSDFVIRDA